MKVVIFIGHHKTGSASLQEFLSQNALALMRAGILYPAVEAEGMSLLLKRALKGRDHVETLPFNLREAHNALAFRMLTDVTGGTVPAFHPGLPSTDEMFKIIEHQITALRPKAVILASEVMGNFSSVSTDLISNLIALFKGAHVRIIANLRRVDDHMVAWHGQRLRFGEKINSLKQVGMTPYKNGIHFDYRRLLDGWRSKAPGAEIVLRTYANVLEAGGTPQDFMRQSGLKFPGKLLAVREANRGLHRGLFEISRLGNQHLNTHDASRLFDFLMRVTPALDLPNSKDIELFTQAIRANIATNFAPVHEYLGSLSGHTPFFSDLSEIRIPLPYDGDKIAQEALAQIRQMRCRIPTQTLGEFLNDLDMSATTSTENSLFPHRKINSALKMNSAS